MTITYESHLNMHSAALIAYSEAWYAARTLPKDMRKAERLVQKLALEVAKECIEEMTFPGGKA